MTQQLYLVELQLHFDFKLFLKLRFVMKMEEKFIPHSRKLLEDQKLLYPISKAEKQEEGKINKINSLMQTRLYDSRFYYFQSVDQPILKDCIGGTPLNSNEKGNLVLARLITNCVPLCRNMYADRSCHVPILVLKFLD